MRNCALLRNPRHQAMIMPVSLVRTRLIHIYPINWIIYCSFEIFLERKLSIGLEFKANVLCKSIASKNIQSDMNYIFKMSNRRGQSGSSVRARENVYERMNLQKKIKAGAAQALTNEPE